MPGDHLGSKGRGKLKIKSLRNEDTFKILTENTTKSNVWFIPKCLICYNMRNDSVS